MKTRKPQAFTLVEMLVVIAIIAILAALGTYGVIGARNAALRFQVTSQLNSVSLALESYKNKYGEYPPDFTDRDAVVRHLQKRWPRYSPKGTGTATTTYGKFCEDVTANTPWDFVATPPHSAEALAFWLGGMPSSDGTRLSGFSQNPTDPFDSGQRDAPLFEISEEAKTLIKSNRNYPMVAARDLPIVYFRGTTGSSDALRKTAYARPIPDGNDTYYIPKHCSIHLEDGEFLGEAVAYAESGNLSTTVKDCSHGSPAYVIENSDHTKPETLEIQWYNSTTFQLIHPGLDGCFAGQSRKSGAGDRREDPDVSTSPYIFFAEMTNQTGVTPLDLDNIVHYAEGGTVDSLLK